MFIIWGKKRVTRRLGYVADFCPLCRDIRAFELTRVGLAGHVYYISVSEGELAGYERTCKVCNTVLNGDPQRYATISERLLPAGELQPVTFPTLTTYWAARLGVERELKSVFGKVNPEDRPTLLREPFLLLSPKVEQRFASSVNFDWPAGLTLLIALAALFIVPFIAGKVAPSAIEPALALCVAGGMIAVLVQVILARGRFMRAEILPLLASALRPLKPTLAEISVVLKELKKAGHKIGSKLKAVEVVSQLASRTAAPGALAASRPTAGRS